MRALQLIKDGTPRALVCEYLGVNKSTLKTWIERDAHGHRPWSRAEITAARRGGHTVAQGRRVRDMLDAGIPLKQVARETGVYRNTIRKWLNEPKRYEATMEYDPTYTYDINDLMDRATVAQYLCSQVRAEGRYLDGKAERLEILFAAIDYPGDETE